MAYEMTSQANNRSLAPPDMPAGEPAQAALDIIRPAARSSFNLCFLLSTFLLSAFSISAFPGSYSGGMSTGAVP
jgi:hypothetical protein